MKPTAVGFISLTTVISSTASVETENEFADPKIAVETEIIQSVLAQKLP